MTLDKKLTHIAGMFVIQADGAFLNGAGLGEGEDRNTTVPKMVLDGRFRIPYVSSQSWRRWLRNTLIQETGWEPSEIRATKLNAKGNTSKIGSETNPIDFAEDDIFGYMRTAAADSEPTEAEDEMDDDAANGIEDKSSANSSKKVKPVMRPSPFASSLLIAIRRGQKLDSIDNGYVHPTDGTPLPYSTKFYIANLQAIFCLDYARLGVYRNIGDRIELAEELVDGNLKTGKVVIVEDLGKKGKIYAIKDASLRKIRTGALLKALAVLRGGAKQAQFGTDVSPKLIIAAGMTCGNPIFNNLLDDSVENGLSLKVEVLKELLSEFGDRIVTPVYIGVRKDYLSNESDARKFAETMTLQKVIVCTPREAMDRLTAHLT